MSCSFKFAHYKESLHKAIQLGYKFQTFASIREDDKGGKCIILRHDIDFSVERALEFAKIEQSFGINATYFVRLHAKTYNPFEFRSYIMLREIRDMGHEIGLHFEALDIEHITGEDPLGVFRRERCVLESILGVTITSAAQHGDFSGVSRDWEKYFFLRFSKEEAGILNQPFEPRFFEEMRYISDSLGTWRDGCMCGHIGKDVRLQILTHPEYWYHTFYHIG